MNPIVRDRTPLAKVIKLAWILQRIENWELENGIMQPAQPPPPPEPNFKDEVIDDCSYDELIKVKILDTETGEITAGDLSDTDRTFWFWSEGNGSCDCNRELCFDREEYHETGRCLGCERYLIVWTSKGDLRELNQGYPQELVDKFIPGSTDGEAG